MTKELISSWEAGQKECELINLSNKILKCSFKSKILVVAKESISFLFFTGFKEEIVIISYLFHHKLSPT